MILRNKLKLHESGAFFMSNCQKKHHEEFWISLGFVLLVFVVIVIGKFLWFSPVFF